MEGRTEMTCPGCGWSEDAAGHATMLFTVAFVRGSTTVAVNCPSCGYYEWTAHPWALRRWALLAALARTLPARPLPHHTWGGWDARLAAAVRAIVTVPADRAELAEETA